MSSAIRPRPHVFHILFVRRRGSRVGPPLAHKARVPGLIGFDGNEATYPSIAHQKLYLPLTPLFLLLMTGKLLLPVYVILATAVPASDEWRRWHTPPPSQAGVAEDLEQGSFTACHRVSDVFHLFSLRLFTINRRNFTHPRRGRDSKWSEGGLEGGKRGRQGLRIS